MGNNNSSQLSERRLRELQNELERNKRETEIHKKNYEKLIEQEKERARAAQAQARAREELALRKSMKEEIKKEVLKTLEKDNAPMTQPSAPPITLAETERNIPNPNNFHLDKRQHEILVQRAAPSYPPQAPYNPYELPATSLYPQITTTSKTESSSSSASIPPVGSTNEGNNKNGGRTANYLYPNITNGDRNDVTDIPSTSRLQNTKNASAPAAAVLHPKNDPSIVHNPSGNTGAIKRNGLHPKNDPSTVHNPSGNTGAIKRNGLHPKNDPSTVHNPSGNTGAIKRNGRFAKPDKSAQSARPDNARSSSKGRPTTRDAKDDELKCPTCNCKYLKERFIYQCYKNHSSCAVCKDGAVPCGICGETITELRNMKLEAHVAQKKRPCVNRHKGCRVMVNSIGMARHLQECAHNVTLCPLKNYVSDCTWEGNAFALKAHFDECHPFHCIGDVDKELFLINFRQECRIIHLVQMGAHTFVVHMMKDDDFLYMTVLVYGTKKFASRWIYELHVYNRMVQHRVYQHTDVCHPASDDVETIFEESSCIVIPVSYAETFINDNENVLSYKFFIKNLNC